MFIIKSHLLNKMHLYVEFGKPIKHQYELNSDSLSDIVNQYKNDKLNICVLTENTLYIKVDREIFKDDLYSLNEMVKNHNDTLVTYLGTRILNIHYSDDIGYYIFHNDKVISLSSIKIILEFY